MFLDMFTSRAVARFFTGQQGTAWLHALPSVRGRQVMEEQKEGHSLAHGPTDTTAAHTELQHI